MQITDESQDTVLITEVILKAQRNPIDEVIKIEYLSN